MLRVHVRILFTIPTLDPAYGGPARSVPALALSVQRAGAAEVQLLPADGSVSPTEGLRFITTLPVLESCPAGRNPFDLIHDNGIWQPCHHRIAQYARLHGIPRVVSPRGMLEPWALTQGRWKKRLAWLLYQRRDLKGCLFLHATADSEAQGFQRLGLHSPTITIPNGTTLPTERSLRARGMARPGAIRRALFLSRIHPKKGIELLIDAWQDCRPAQWRLTIAGPGEGAYIASLRSRIETAGIQDQIEFAGPVSDTLKTSAYLESDLFLLPSYSENFGLVVAEALAHGVPVITTTGCPWEDLHRHRCGWWVPPTSAGIAGALKTATGMPDGALREMGMRGRELVSKTCDWGTIGARMLAAYRSMLVPASTATS